MTKPQRWRQREAALAEARTAPRNPRPGDEVHGALINLPPYAPAMLRAADTRCYACDQLIERGHTVFLCKHHPHPAPVLCYQCGVAWCLHRGDLTITQADAIPPIGGPAS